MDYPLFFALAGVAMLFFSWPVLKSQWLGQSGERRVRRGLRRIGAVCLNDVYLPLRDRIAQIDHLVCTEKGIVILETKDWGGILQEQGPGKPWILQQGPYTRTRHNPKDQNLWHRRAVSACSGKVPLYTWVVLAGSGRFRGPNPSEVFTIRETLSQLQNLGVEPDRIPQEIQVVWEGLTKKRLQDRASRRRQLRQATRSTWRYVREGYALEVFGAGLGFLALAAMMIYFQI